MSGRLKAKYKIGWNMRVQCFHVVQKYLAATAQLSAKIAQECARACEQERERA